MITTFQIILTILCVVACAYIDNEHLVDGDYIEDHKSRFVQRLLFVLAIGHLNVLDTIGSGLLFASLFDMTLNLMIHKKIVVRLGNTALWDLFWKKRMTLYKITLLASFILGMYLIYKP